MYSDIDLGLVYLLLRTANRPLIRTKLNKKIVKNSQKLVKINPLGLVWVTNSQTELTLSKLIHFWCARSILTHNPKSLLPIFDDHWRFSFFDFLTKLSKIFSNFTSTICCLNDSIAVQWQQYRWMAFFLNYENSHSKVLGGHMGHMIWVILYDSYNMGVIYHMDHKIWHLLWSRSGITLFRLEWTLSAKTFTKLVKRIFSFRIKGMNKWAASNPVR